jgi:hypothetical protein
MGRRAVEFTPYAREAAELMGANVRRQRVAMGWTLEELGARAGCTRYTVAAIERGTPSVSVGNLFNVYAALRLPLFTPDPVELSRLNKLSHDIIALLPSRVDPDTEVDDDF